MNDPMVIYKTLDINRDGHISADEFGSSASYLKRKKNEFYSNVENMYFVEYQIRTIPKHFKYEFISTFYYKHFRICQL